jgi:predicted transcriptional regulator
MLAPKCGKSSIANTTVHTHKTHHCNNFVSSTPLPHHQSDNFLQHSALVARSISANPVTKACINSTDSVNSTDNAAYINRTDSAAYINSTDSAAYINSTDSAAYINRTDSAAYINRTDSAAYINRTDSAAYINRNDSAAYKIQAF